jgi:hypothetical protein
VLGSLAFFLVWEIIGSGIIAVVFSGEIQLSLGTLALLGLSVAGVFLARATELLVMVPQGMERLVYQANTTLSLIGLVAFVILARPWGVVGGLAVVCICCLILLGVYGFALLFGWRRSVLLGHRASLSAAPRD